MSNDPNSDSYWASTPGAVRKDSNDDLPAEARVLDEKELA